MDEKTAESMRKTLLAFKGSRTIIVIAHRLQDVVVCDQVAVLEGEEVVEMGRWNCWRKSAECLRAWLRVWARSKHGTCAHSLLTRVEAWQRRLFSSESWVRCVHLHLHDVHMSTVFIYHLHQPRTRPFGTTHQH